MDQFWKCHFWKMTKGLFSAYYQKLVKNLGDRLPVFDHHARGSLTDQLEVKIEFSFRRKFEFVKWSRPRYWLGNTYPWPCQSSNDRSPQKWPGFLKQVDHIKDWLFITNATYSNFQLELTSGKFKNEPIGSNLVGFHLRYNSWQR